jgi:hypothetical protein
MSQVGMKKRLKITTDLQPPYRGGIRGKKRLDQNSGFVPECTCISALSGTQNIFCPFMHNLFFGGVKTIPSIERRGIRKPTGTCCLDGRRTPIRRLPCSKANDSGRHRRRVASVGFTIPI